MARPRQVTDDEILEAARACFLEDPSASTNTIASRIGLSQAAVFKRFGTKMRLLMASMGMEDGPSWTQMANAGPDERPMEEQLEELGTTIMDFFTLMIPRLAVLKAAGLTFRRMFGDDVTPPPVVGYQALTGFFERAIAQGLVRQGDPSGLAISFLGMFQARAFWRHFAAGYFTMQMDDAEYVRHIVDLYWRGVAPEETPS